MFEEIMNKVKIYLNCDVNMIKCFYVNKDSESIYFKGNKGDYCLYSGNGNVTHIIKASDLFERSLKSF